MRKRSCLILLLLLCGFIWSDSIEYEIEFPEPAVEESYGYSVIQYSDCVELGKEGEPVLPYKAVNLLLPPETSAFNVSITEIDYYKEKLNLRILPGTKPVPMSSISYDKFEFREGKVYQGKGTFPENITGSFRTDYKNGHAIACFTVCPVVYYPSLDSVLLVESIKITVSYTNSIRERSLYKHDQQIEKELELLVENPEMLEMYPTSNKRVNSIDILVITSQELSSCFSEYLEYKKRCGYTSEILTVEEIYAEYSGIDEQEQIRNAIIDRYECNDIKYVILGGDSSPVNAARNVVPHRGFYGLVGGDEDLDIPSDMYYCCLDGNWNTDNDEKWGEYEEGDYLEEVSIGRICGATPEEICNQLDKMMSYEHEPVESDLEKCLLVGQQMSTVVYGGEFLDEIAEGSDNWGYSTAGVSENIELTHLYEMYEDWDSYDLFSEINEGTNLVNNVGHGGTVYALNTPIELLNTDNIANDGISHGYYNCYSQACYCGAFDNRTTNAEEYEEESFAEKMCIMETGAASFIANSRYGWFMPANTNGASQRFAREFYDTLFGYEILKMGKANAITKEKNIALIEDSVYRWIYINLNLLGDPTMEIWTCIPQDMEIEFPENIYLADSEIAYNCSENNLQYAIFMDGELLGCGNSGYFPCSSFLLDNAISNTGMLDVYVNKANFSQLHTQLEVLPVDNAFVISEIEISDGNGWHSNGIAEYGEEINISFLLTNVGVECADNLQIRLSSSDDYLELIDSLASIDTIESGETVFINDSLSFELKGDYPDLHTARINLQLVNGEETIQEVTYSFRGFGAKLVMEEFSISDDNNNLLEPGEAGELGIIIKNEGHVVSQDVNIELCCTHQNINIHNYSQNIGSIAPGDTGEVLYQIHCEEEISYAEIIEFIMIISSGGYLILETEDYYLGVETEGFESNGFDKFDWEFSSGFSWETSSDAHTGNFSACTHYMCNCYCSRIKLAYETSQDGYISFWFKTDTFGSGIGYMSFYIDYCPPEFSANGDNGWTKVNAFVTAGEHEFGWTYFTYMACASKLWVDDIIFPPKAWSTETDEAIIIKPEIQSYPNPFNPEVTISYTLQQYEKEVLINIYNVKGQSVRKWVRNYQSPGNYEIIWDGKLKNGAEAGSGIYLYKLITSQDKLSGKMMLVK